VLVIGGGQAGLAMFIGYPGCPQGT